MLPARARARRSMQSCDAFVMGSKVPYNQTLDEPRFVDKFGGLPVVRNITELKEAVNRGKRTWLIFAPYASFEKLSSPKVLDYLDKNARTVYETYRAKVLLIEGDAASMVERGGKRTASNSGVSATQGLATSRAK